MYRIDYSLEAGDSNGISDPQYLRQAEAFADWLRLNAPDLLTQGASPTIMFANIGDRNIHTMLVGTTLALVLISLILVVALRSIKTGMISMIPNLVLAMSIFYLNAGMGLLTAIVLFFALLADFLFLPPPLLLIRIEGRLARGES